MSRKVSVGLSIIFLCLMTALSFTACSSNQEFIDFADIAAENYLIAANDQDFDAFSKDLSNEMKELLPEAEFLVFADQIEGLIGNYIKGSKKFLKTEKESGYIAVLYKADYSEEPAGVEVRIVLQKIDGVIKIAGSFFNSPKLRGE